MSLGRISLNGVDGLRRLRINDLDKCFEGLGWLYVPLLDLFINLLGHLCVGCLDRLGRTWRIVSIGFPESRRNLEVSRDVEGLIHPDRSLTLLLVPQSSSFLLL